MQVKMTATDKKLQAEYEKREKEYRAEGDLRTLIEAAKICKDPDRHAAVMAKKKLMMADLENIKAEY